MIFFRRKKKKTLRINKKLEWLKALFIAFLILLFLKIVAFQTFTVSNSTMENSLFPGDFVFVNKLGYGARLPITLLSIPFIGDQLPFSENRSYSDLIQLPYLRLPGLGDIQKNDLICFNYPIEEEKPTDKKTILFKRCVALPGDTLAIIDKKIFVNRNLIPAKEECKFHYQVKFNDTVSSSFIEKYAITEGGISDKMNVYDFFLTKRQFAEIAEDSSVISINLIKVKKGKENNPYFPQSNKYNWSRDYFGPVILPAKGTTINLNSENIDLYRSIIETYEHNSLKIENDTIFVNDTITKQYTFHLNYYFVIDDNRDNGKDSRLWGFLPEDHIIGKATMVWYSIEKRNESTNIRWNRIFKLM